MTNGTLPARAQLGSVRLAGDPAKVRIRASNWRSVIVPLFLDLNPSLAVVGGVVGSNVVREVLDYLAVPYQQEVVVDRHRVGDVIEEVPHVFIAMALAARVHLGRWSSC